MRSRNSKPSDTASRAHSDPVDVDAINSLASGKGKGSSSPRDGYFKCGGAHFQRDCTVDANPRKGNGTQSSGKGKQAKERVRKVRETENPKVPKVRAWVKLRKLVHMVLETRNQGQVGKLRNRHRRITLTLRTWTILCLMMAGVRMKRMMTGIRRWFRDSGVQQNWPCNADALREMCEFVNTSQQPGNDCGRAVHSQVRRKL